MTRQNFKSISLLCFSVLSFLSALAHLVLEAMACTPFLFLWEAACSSSPEF